MLLSWIFISPYTTIYFFLKKFICSKVYISVNTIFKGLYMFFWIRKGPSIKHVCNWHLVRDGGELPSKMCTAAYRWDVMLMCTYACFCFFFSCFRQYFCLIVSCFICRNLTLPLFTKDMFVRNGYFSSARSISVIMK